MNINHTSLTNKPTSAAIATDAALSEEDLASISAGFFPFIAAGVAALAGGGAAALWGHKRPGLINR